MCGGEIKMTWQLGAALAFTDTRDVDEGGTRGTDAKRLFTLQCRFSGFEGYTRDDVWGAIGFMSKELRRKCCGTVINMSQITNVLGILKQKLYPLNLIHSCQAGEAD